MDTLEQINSMLDNDKFSTVASLVIALYAGLAAPALPNSVILFFDTLVGKLLFLFLIGFMASRNVQVALMIAVAFVVTLHVVNQRTTEQYFNFTNENFTTNKNVNPQEAEVNSDFTTNVDEQFSSDHPLSEEAHEPEEAHQPENYIQLKDTFRNEGDPPLPENFIQLKDTFQGDEEPPAPEKFRNYRLEGFEDEEPPASENFEENPIENLSEEDVEDDFDVEVEEAEQDKPEEAHMGDEEDDTEGFYSNINPSVKNFGVNGAFNTSGSTGHMFAPVRFN
tara:strand:- start:877 stop:1713 length:837 start_codon:yes stop_codon:yes gene_type:complete